MSRGRRKRRSSRQRTGRKILPTGVLPKEERLPPMAFTARMILNIQRAPRCRVVDAGFDMICRMHGYIPMKVLTFLLDEGLVFVDDSHPHHKVIGLTQAGLRVGLKK